MPVKTYDFKAVALILGGFTITAFGEDGGVEIEPDADVAEFSVGADGQVTISRSNNKAMVATITVRESGNGYRILGELLEAQEAQTPIAALPFIMQDEITGERVSDESAVFIGRPTIAKNATVGDREFRILLPQGAANTLAAPNNTP